MIFFFCEGDVPEGENPHKMEMMVSVFLPQDKVMGRFSLLHTDACRGTVWAQLGTNVL
jgi:hypothetical protein